jgi:thiamine-monophosphate kinase
VPHPQSRTLADLGEFGLIAVVAERLGSPPPGVAVGAGDDAAVVAAPDGHAVVTTDLLVEGVHFRRDWSSAADVGAKAAAQNLADVAAMGASPTALVVGLVAPPQTETAWILELLDGLLAEASAAGAAVVGGDTVAGPVVMVSVTALGDLGGRPAVLRSGAAIGDSVAVCGRLGHAAAGLAVLSRGFRSPRTLVDAHRRPAPPYDAGPSAAQAGATAMCDVSDGLLADLGHIAEASGVAMVVDAARLTVDEPLVAAAAALGVDPLGWVLSGGEDHALAATFPPGSVPQGWQEIGEVVAGSGVTVPGVETSTPGYRHFAG